MTDVLAARMENPQVRFPWPLLKDRLRDCVCYVSGTALEIVPQVPLFDQFPPYREAQHRVFMSATITDDSFLVRGLGLAREVVTSPLVDPDETWSGEKMILIPSLIDSTLDREAMITRFTSTGSKTGTFGVVALVPSFAVAAAWGMKSGLVAKTTNIGRMIEDLRNGKSTKTYVFANRYDGIDLPDNACRILVIDGLPQGERLPDRYQEATRAASHAVQMRLTRTVEQGLGRSVRGARDYSMIVLIGVDLVHHVQSAATRNYFSDQTRAQIAIGLDITQLAKEDLENQKPMQVLTSLVNQSLRRDDGWKDFYVERMNAMTSGERPAKMLEVFEREAKADRALIEGRLAEASREYQGLADDARGDQTDRGWYLQEAARAMWHVDRVKADELQRAAHIANGLLLKPRSGIIIKKMTAVSQRRMERIVAWAKRQGDHSQVMVVLDALLGQLAFGVAARRFEGALNQLAEILGFAGEMPDRTYGEGPDNLWALGGNEFLLWECKNEVKTDRELIHKDETGQMNNSMAWFRQHCGDAALHARIVIPTALCGPGAAFSEAVGAIRVKELKQLSAVVRECFDSLRDIDLKDLSETKMQQLIKANNLDVVDLRTKYFKAAKAG